MSKPVEFTDEEFAVLNMTAQTIGKDLLSALVDEIRTLPDVWQKLSEQKQADIIERCTKRVDYNVKRAVHLIASDWFKALKDIASASGESIDEDDEEDAWFDLSLTMTPQDAFYSLYPDHKPADESVEPQQYDHDGSTND